ncbi:DNA-directed RNA polymerase II subunit 4 isoform X2 [Cryptomeria japonica]|uniref:DNA-directed RNA polymerase II subunit 4 isoform X2 n=1 Tax=Cryptomeria japonica TaxID=3369 RepID=UPI0025ABD709|nr:DNA-directed RNA polymerase II subunit 4 isoform X2 [Cryptomeria japonica]
MASASGEAEENAAEVKIGEEFLKAKCLMNAEVALILEKKYDQLQQVSEDASCQVSQVFERSLQYATQSSRYKNPGAVKQVRDVLSRNSLSEFEHKGRGLHDEKIDIMLSNLASIRKLE